MRTSLSEVKGQTCGTRGAFSPRTFERSCSELASCEIEMLFWLDASRRLVLALLVLQQTLLCDSHSVGKCSTPLARCRGDKWHHDAVCSLQNDCIVASERTFSFVVEAKMKPLDAARGANRVGSLWMRGSGPGISWEKPVELRRSGSSVDSWKAEVKYRSSSDALLCASGDYCFSNQKALEFRLYRDQMGRDDMLGPNFYVQLPVSESMHGDASFLTPTATVYPWFDGDAVETRQFPVESSLNVMGEPGQFKITLDVLYPPSFEYNIRKKYPLVVYLGSYPESLVPLLEYAFVHESHIQEAMVVAVSPLDEPPFRILSPYLHSYVWQCKEKPCKVKECATCWLPRISNACDKKEFAFQAKRCLFPELLPSYGEAVLDFIEMDILPKIREVTQERVLVDFPRERLSIVGDLDGASLLACYAALTRPHIYQNAACLSAPFYWPLTASVTDPAPNPGIQRTLRDIGKTLSETPALRPAYLTQRYYIDISFNQHATLPLVDVYRHTEDFVQGLQEILFLEKGKNILYFTVPDVVLSHAVLHTHPLLSVYNRLLPALKFFLRAEGGPSKDGARMRPVLDKAIAEQSELYGGLVRSRSNSSSSSSSSSSSPAVAGQLSCDAEYTAPSRGLSRPSEVPIIFFLPILGDHYHYEIFRCVCVYI